MPWRQLLLVPLLVLEMGHRPHLIGPVFRIACPDPSTLLPSGSREKINGQEFSHVGVPWLYNWSSSTTFEHTGAILDSFELFPKISQSVEHMLRELLKEVNRTDRWVGNSNINKPPLKKLSTGSPSQSEPQSQVGAPSFSYVRKDGCPRTCVRSTVMKGQDEMLNNQSIN